MPDLIKFICFIKWSNKDDMFSGALQSEELCFIRPASEEYLKVK